MKLVCLSAIEEMLFPVSLPGCMCFSKSVILAESININIYTEKHVGKCNK